MRTLLRLFGKSFADGHSTDANRHLMRFSIAIGLLGLCGCATELTPPPANSIREVTSQRSDEMSGSVCVGRLRMKLPTGWSISRDKSGISGQAPRGDKLRIVHLHRPSTDGQTEEPSAEATLHEFVALKMASIRTIARIKRLDPYSLFAVPAFPAASVAVLYEEEPTRDDYAIQYLLAEPGHVYMLTFTRTGVVDAVLSIDKAQFDAIVGSAKQASTAFDADVAPCVY